MRYRTAKAALATGALVAALTCRPAAAHADAPPPSVTPGSVALGGSVTITGPAGAPCGGQVGDGPTIVFLSVFSPTVGTVHTFSPDSSGNWHYTVSNVDAPGHWTVNASCAPDLSEPTTVPAPRSGGEATTAAVGFTYASAGFEVVDRRPVAPMATAPTGTVAPGGTAGAALVEPTFTG